MDWPSDQMSANELLRRRPSLLQQNLDESEECVFAERSVR